MKSFKRKVVSVFLAALIAVGTLGVPVSASVSTSIGSVGTSASVYRSNPSSWNVFYTYGIPTNLNRYSGSGSVTGLVNGQDTGITFNCSTFTKGSNSNLQVRCDINPNLKKYPNTYAIISSLTSVSTCLFKDDWWSKNGYSGAVSYTYQAENYVQYQDFYVAGNAF